MLSSNIDYFKYILFSRLMFNKIDNKFIYILLEAF